MDWSFVGDLPAWITAAAVIFAGSQYLIERDRRRDEQDRAERMQASQLSAWPVSNRHSQPLAYGVLISNRSTSTFHDVVVEAVLFGNRQQKLALKVLPPGDYFVPIKDSEWDFPLSTAEYGGHLRPYTRTDRYFIASMAFTDNRGRIWHTDRRMLLTSAAAS